MIVKSNFKCYNGMLLHPLGREVIFIFAALISIKDYDLNKQAILLTLNVRFFSWELQVNFRVQFNAKQSFKPKRDILSVTCIIQ